MIIGITESKDVESIDNVFWMNTVFEKAMIVNVGQWTDKCDIALWNDLVLLREVVAKNSEAKK